MRYIKLLLVSMILIVNACGGGSADTDSNTGLPAPAVPLTGVFLDSPVINVDYTNATGSRTGVTNALGEYEYLSRETMTFSIGDLQFPSVYAEAIITPMDMANSLNTSNSKVTNIVRLLMTLDQDGNPDNGITITDTAKAIASPVNFLLTEEEFAALDNDAVRNLILNAGQDPAVTELVSVADAVTHFETQLALNDIPFGTIPEQNDKAIQKYLSDNNLEAIAHESGLYYQITVEGSGDSPISTSTVEVRYKGSLLNGTVFDQTAGNSTTSFSLTNLVTGWQKALPLLKAGGTGVFYIPASLGYGTSGSGVIPANAVLIFKIELVSFTN